jgi:hypothetical protein
MEGRLMLATTVIDFLPAGLTPAEINLDADQPAFTASPLPFAPSSREGGFITAPLAPGADFIDSSPAEDSLTPQANPTKPQIEVPAEAITNGTTGTNTTSGDFVLSTESPAGPGGLYLFDNSGIQPAVITSLESLRSTNGFVGPVVAASDRNELTRGEGGPISIAAVLSSIQPRENMETQEPGPTQFAATSDERSATDWLDETSHAAAGREITGELARAMVFEIAGGEPANASGATRADRLHDQPGDQADPDAPRPVSYHEGPLAPRGQVSRSTLTRPVSFVRHDGMNDTDRPALEHSYLVDNDGGELLPPMPLSERKSGVHGASESSRSGEVTSAYPGIFEHLGEEAELAANPPAIAFSWRTALNATPLLMVLALERIAASNSRRASRHEAFISTKKSMGRKRSFEHLIKNGGSDEGR